jgi:hypothetical protein
MDNISCNVRHHKLGKGNEVYVYLYHQWATFWSSHIVDCYFFLILTLPFIFILIFSGRCGLNRINFNSLNRGRSRSIFYIRIIIFRIGVSFLWRSSLSMEGANHTINTMRIYWMCWGRIRGRTRSIKD